MMAVRRLLIIIFAVLTAGTAVAQTNATGPGTMPEPKSATSTRVKKNVSPQALSESTASTIDPSTPRTPPAVAETDRDLDDPRALRLSLDEAVRTTVEKNLGVEIERYDYRMFGRRLAGQYGIFDPELTGSFQKSNSKFPTVSTVSASSSRSTSANFGISQTLPTGGTYSIGFNNSRVAQEGGGTFLTPSYNAGLGFSASQPLLRNFGTDVTRRGIDIARNNLGISQETFRGVLMNTAVSVEQAYLDLVYARRYVDVVKESLFLARDQSRITQIRIDVGASAPLDILQPRVQIATQEESLIAAQANVRDAEDRLRQLMHLDPSEWDRPIIPTDAVSFRPFAVNVADAVARAYELRPEVREAAYGTEIRRIQYRFARNQMLPQVDVNLGYRAAGVGGTLFTTDPVTRQTVVVSDTRYPHALNQVFQNEFPSWSIGVNLSVPLFNIGARAEAKRAELDFRQSRTTELQRREQIAIEVRKTARDMDTAAKEISASRAARDAAEQNLDAERKRYQNGMTTNFNVLQIQQQLSDARVREIQSVVAHNKAVANYHRAVGDLLDIRNISVAEERPEISGFVTKYQNWFERYDFLRYGKHVQNDPVLNEAPAVILERPQP